MMSFAGLRHLVSICWKMCSDKLIVIMVSNKSFPTVRNDNRLLFVGSAIASPDPEYEEVTP